MVAVPLGRTERARGFVVVGSLTLRSLPAVLLASDMTEGGRLTLGLPKMEDSRRKEGLGARPDTPLIDVRLPARRFNYKSLWSTLYPCMGKTEHTWSSSCCLEASAIFRLSMSSLSAALCFAACVNFTS